MNSKTCHPRIAMIWALVGLALGLALGGCGLRAPNAERNAAARATFQIAMIPDTQNHVDTHDYMDSHGRLRARVLGFS